MGNAQSEATDKDGVPRYSYHVNVLREAKATFVNCDTTTTEFDHDHDNEQYFSAEESDSLHGSLTPERTRPESSSDDHLSDSHDYNEDNTLNVSERNEPYNKPVVHLDVSANTDTKTNHQAGVHAQQSVNTYSENCAVDTELVNSTQRSGNNFVSLIDNSEQNIDISLQLNNVAAQLSGGQTVCLNSPCQSVPVHPAISLISSNTSSENEKPFTNSGKRKIPEDSREVVIPRKRMLTRSSFKRKWLGYSDSSESEMGKGKEGNRKSHKKGKTVIFSPKKSRRVDHDFRDEDSDERKYGKKKCLKNSWCNYNSESSESDDVAEKYKLKTNCQKRRQNYSMSSDSSSDISEETSKHQKRQKSYRNETNNTERNESRKSYRHMSSQCDNENVPSHQSQQTQVSISEDTKSMAISNTLNNNADTSVSFDMSNRPCHTFKMGNQSLRNAQGKVFPIRFISQKDSACSAIISTDNVSASSDLGSSMTNLTPRHLESVNFHSSAFEKNQVFHAEREPLNNLPASLKNTRSNWVLPADSDGLLQDKLDASPFINVNLVPPSKNTTVKNISKQPVVYKLTEHFEAEDDTSDMDVEDSDVTMENHTDIIDSMPSNLRGVLQNQRRHKTVTTRLKTFWLEKKKNLGENLKSLFSKAHSPLLETPMGTPSPIWQTSRSSQNSAWKSLQLKSPTTSFNRSHLQGSLLDPFLQKQVSPEQYQTKGIAVLPFEFKEQIGADSTPQIVVRSDSTRSQSVNHDSLISQELPQIVMSTSSRLTNSTANSLVESLSQTRQCQLLDCCLAGSIDISICISNIADQKTAAIVNWTDGALTHTVTSCSKSIAAKAGALMRATCNDYIENKGSNLKAPDVLITPAGGTFDRSVEAILHVVEPSWIGGDEVSNSRALVETFVNCLRFAYERLGLDSISFPLIGNGVFPFNMCVKSFSDAVLVFLTEHYGRRSLFRIQLIISDITTASLAADLVRSYLKQMCDKGLESEAEKTYNHYFGHKQNVSSGTQVNISACSPQQSFTVERTISGRPRLKRPRF